LLKENSDETDLASISREDDVIVEKKLKKIDKGQLYKPLSNDELHQLRETENLFHSSVFKLQVMCDSIIGIIF
jgi:hypothetical protein